MPFGSPLYELSPKDAGYDVSDYTTLTRSLEHLKTLIRFFKAHDLGLKVIVDLVPNHSSSEHPLFKAALRAGKGSPERSYYHFADGKGKDGELPPNNWQSVFGGPAWTRIDDGSGIAHL